MRSISEPIIEAGEAERSTDRSLPLWPSFAALAVVLGALFALRSLDYSTSQLSRGSLTEVARAPQSIMQIGDVRWRLADYQAASLDVFRQSFAKCSDDRGVAAARCVTTLLHERSPHGAPAHEFVDADFDPARAITAHLAGAPGNCTARSAMAATALLALGVPARVVQLLPVDEKGHNVLEVWDDAENGWVLFDPLFDSSYLVAGKFASAAALSAATGGVSWRRPHEGAPDPNAFAGCSLHYPEPWLYTRVGERCATWPFRACFAAVGPEQLRYGPAQGLARTITVLGALFASSWAVWWGRRRKLAVVSS